MKRGMKADLSELTGPRRKPPPPQLNLLGQFLAPAISSLCNRAEVATSLACTATDIRALISHRLGYSSPHDDPPVLLSGWRAELIGSLIDELLQGKKSIRIGNPKSPEPLEFESA